MNVTSRAEIIFSIYKKGDEKAIGNYGYISLFKFRL